MPGKRPYLKREAVRLSQLTSTGGADLHQKEDGFSWNCPGCSSPHQFDLQEKWPRQGGNTNAVKSEDYFLGKNQWQFYFKNQDLHGSGRISIEAMLPLIGGNLVKLLPRHY